MYKSIAQVAAAWTKLREASERPIENGKWNRCSRAKFYSTEWIDFKIQYIWMFKGNLVLNLIYL